MYCSSFRINKANAVAEQLKMDDGLTAMHQAKPAALSRSPVIMVA
jgi:hypothetical protein